MSFITLSNAKRKIFRLDIKDCNFIGGEYKKNTRTIGV